MAAKCLKAIMTFNIISNYDLNILLRGPFIFNFPVNPFRSTNSILSFSVCAVKIPEAIINSVHLINPFVEVGVIDFPSWTFMKCI